MPMESRQRIVLRKRAVFNRSVSAGPLGGSRLPAAVDVQVEATELSSEEVIDLRRDPEVEMVADAMPLKLIEPVGTAEATPMARGNTWGIESIGADTSPFDGSGVVVAVLDTGINPDHIAFEGVDLVQRNFTQGSDDDDHGHGTHCAGTIFGRDVHGLRIGVARGVKKALIGKVLGLGGGSSADLANAINWAYENGANVISMSLGFDFAGYVEELHELHGVPIPAATSIALEQYRANVHLFGALSELLEKAGSFAQPAIIVAASGNESSRPEFEIAVAPPAAGDGVISVGAMQRSSVGNLSVAPFSNSQCNLCGPGVSVTSAWIGAEDALQTLQGTSMATPHVAGCAALWAEKIKTVTGGQLTSENWAAKLLATAEFVPGQSFDDIGNGMVKAPS